MIRCQQKQKTHGKNNTHNNKCTSAESLFSVFKLFSIVATAMTASQWKWRSRMHGNYVVKYTMFIDAMKVEFGNFSTHFNTSALSFINASIGSCNKPCY
mmetsp:Transcript_16515/g.46154  ORF Transcript_16515/g.46154 Transcript_16515/m.46154 type:complete len:99 (-) Transcript_16515:92-388(-)